MILDINAENVGDAVRFAWGIYINQVTSSYPLHENIDSMRKKFEKTVSEGRDRLIGVYDGDELAGVMRLFIEPGDKYLQSDGCYFRESGFEAFSELFEALKSEYGGFTMMFGYPKEALVSSSFALRIGAKLIESSARMVLKKKNFIPRLSDIAVLPVTRETFADYAPFHDSRYPESQDIYWTADRVRATFDNWIIYVALDNGRIYGSVFVSVFDPLNAEIFGLTVDDDSKKEGSEETLLTWAAAAALNKGVGSILYMIDDDNASAITAAENAGFRHSGGYLCFKAEL